jgi:hypothetical protein
MSCDILACGPFVSLTSGFCACVTDKQARARVQKAACICRLLGPHNHMIGARIELGIITIEKGKKKKQIIFAPHPHSDDGIFCSPHSCWNGNGGIRQCYKGQLESCNMLYDLCIASVDRCKLRRRG